MPERKVKAKGRPGAGLARAVPALAVALTLLTLTACLPAASRNSSSSIHQVSPAPAALAEATETRPAPELAPYGPAIPAEAGSTQAVPEVIPPAEPAPVQAALSSYEPALPPGSFTFTSGLIDQDNLLARLFPDRLVTAQAGGRLLAAYGLASPLEDEAGLFEAERLPTLEAASRLALPAFDQALADAAPSAGEPPSDRQAEGQTKKAEGERTRKLLTVAYEQTGRPYKPGGLNPAAGFDASGYAHWVFAREGLTLPKTPAALAAAGTAVTRENLRPGDVLIYRNQADQANGWHVGIYSGQGNFLHASAKAGVVTETDAFGPQYAPYFQSGRRFFDDPGAAPLSDSQKMAATSTAVKLALAELGPKAKPAPAPPPQAAPKAASPKGQKAAPR